MNSKRMVGVLALIVTLAPAQTNTALPEFAVASIKPNKTGCCASGGVGNGGSRNRISGGPRWIGSDRFDVEGKAEDPNTDFDQLRLMLRSLLADRFKLKVHRATKDVSVYALVVAKGGPKFAMHEDQTSPDIHGPSAAGSAPNRGAIRIGAGSLTGNAVTMGLFARMLSQRLDRLVVDRTNLAGRFNVQLQWTPADGENSFDPGGNALPSADHASRPSVFTAIQEQLGLKLESARGPVDVLVIDHVERPTAN